MKNQHLIQWSVLKYVLTGVLFSLAVGAAQAGLVAQWNFNEGSGTSAAPAVGSGAGVIHGAAGLKLDGESGYFHTPGASANDYLELGRGDAFNLTNRYSLETWFRVNGGSNTMIIGKHYSLFSLGYVVNSASRYFEFYTGGGANSLAYGGVERGEWYHVVAAYDGSVTSGTNMWLYVNGELAASKLATNITLSANTGSLMIAQNQNLDASQSADADWDQVTVYNHALSAEEVTAMYIAGPVIVESQGTDKDAAGPGALGNTWDVLSQVREFRPRPDAFRAEQKPRVMDRLSGREVDAVCGESSAAYSAAKIGRSFSFRVAGNVPEIRTMWWLAPVTPRDTSATPYYVLRYKAHGQRRDYNSMPVIAVSGVGTNGKAASVSLLDCSEVINDDQWHTVIGRKELAITVKNLEVRLSTVDSEAAFELGGCSFSSTLPDVREAFEQTPLTVANKDYLCLDLSGLFNDEYRAAVERALKTYGKLVDGGGGTFIGESISVGGVPFAVRTTGKNIIVPPKDTNANKGTVNVLGTELSKEYYKRAAREDTITVPASGKAYEVCFILVSEVAPFIGRYALPKIPFQLHNSGAFIVELVYAGGSSDFAFPYSIADRGFTLQRFTGAYAVPADPVRELKAIVFHNRYYGSDFDVAAVTLNIGQTGVIPASVRDPEPYRAAKTARPEPQSAKITRRGNGFTLENGDYLMEVACSNGFAISRFTHKWSPKTDIALKGGGLEIQINDKVLTGRDFTVEKLTTADGRADMELRSKDESVPLRMTVSISGDNSPQIKFNASMVNTGTKPIDAVIRFPVLNGLVIGDLANTWMFFPQCRNILTREYGTYLAPNDRSFVLQFFDMFNPKAGVGLAFLTHNLDTDVLDYSVSKNDLGVKAFIQYPAEYHVVQPGKELKLVETCLAFHGGDWHEALRAYQEWVSAWHKPVKADGLDWWYRLFDIRSHHTAKAYDWVVPIFDDGKNRYRMGEILKEDEDCLGMKPDVVCLYGWIDRKIFYAGDYVGGDFAVEDYTGGPDVLRAAIREMQDDGVRVSVYTIPDRCGKESRIGQRLGARIAVVRADGSLMQNEKRWDVCLGAKEWQDHYVEGLKRTQRETGVNAIYVDVFPYSRRGAFYTTENYTCYSREHGHEIPLNVNKACHDLIRRLRAELPEGVAIWSELPCSDVDSQFTNGNITYYLSLYECWVRSYDKLAAAPGFSPVVQSVHRFAFPRVKQFGLPLGFQSHELGFLFFNGEGLNDCGYLFYDSRDLPRVRNWLAVQKEYADCFSSPNPAPLIQTEAGEVYANEFPGNSRTAWTLFNGRFTTYRGPVLAVEHKEGDTYYDAWNHKELSPDIHGGKAVISLALDPQGVGCVIRKSGKN